MQRTASMQRMIFAINALKDINIFLERLLALQIIQAAYITMEWYMTHALAALMKTQKVHIAMVALLIST